MMRTNLIAALAGSALLLAGCSSTSGTAAPATSSTSSAAVTSSSASSPMSSMTAPASSASSSAPPASSASVSEPPASGPGSSTASSETASSSASSLAPPTTTVGDNTEGLDAQSAAWFTAFCTGTSSLVTGAKQLTGLGSSSSPADQKKVIGFFESLGTSLTRTAATLKGLPAPTFSGGSAFASKVVTAFGSAGPALSAAAKKIAADPSAAGSSAESALSGSLQKAVAPLQDLGSLKLTAATQAGIEKIPACAAVQKAATA